MMIQKNSQNGNVKFIAFAENMLKVKKKRLWSFDNSFEHHYPIVKKKNIPAEVWDQWLQQRELRCSSAACKCSEKAPLSRTPSSACLRFSHIQIVITAN